jgi:hypothetical protein
LFVCEVDVYGLSAVNLLVLYATNKTDNPCSGYSLAAAIYLSISLMIPNMLAKNVFVDFTDGNNPASQGSILPRRVFQSMAGKESDEVI